MYMRVYISLKCLLLHCRIMTYHDVHCFVRYNRIYLVVLNNSYVNN